MTIGKSKALFAALLCGAIFAPPLSAPAVAAPLLQLDIINGRYDWNTKTVVATDDVFTLVALYTRPDWMTLDRAQEYYFSDTYHIAAAIAPRVDTGTDLGSFQFDTDTSSAWAPVNVAVTSGMEYGTPPLEHNGAEYDSGDYPQHDIYNTYFREFTFAFSATQQAATYDAQTTRNGFDPTGTGSYYALFTVDTTNLSDSHVIHFDLYSTKYVSCTKAGTCSDEDLELEAWYTHDAQSAPVPEPGTLLLVGAGLAAVRARYRRGTRNQAA